MTESPSLRVQADEIENHLLGLRNLLDRAEAKLIKRPQEWIERVRWRVAVTQAALQTITELALTEGGRRSA